MGVVYVVVKIIVPEKCLVLFILEEMVRFIIQHYCYRYNLYCIFDPNN